MSSTALAWSDGCHILTALVAEKELKATEEGSKVLDQTLKYLLADHIAGYDQNDEKTILLEAALFSDRIKTLDPSQTDSLKADDRIEAEKLRHPNTHFIAN